MSKRGRNVALLLASAVAGVLIGVLLTTGRVGIEAPDDERDDEARGNDRKLVVPQRVRQPVDGLWLSQAEIDRAADERSRLGNTG